jgi:hypothetical protein
MMRAIKLIFFGAIGTLGILRGAELLIVARATPQALFPLALH